MESRLQQLAGLVEQARRAGARGAEILSTLSEGLEIGVQRGRVVSQRELSSETVTVRCWLDGGCAGRASGVLEGADRLVERALKAAGKAKPSSVEGPVSRLQSVAAGLGIDDRRYGNTALPDKIEVVANGERSVRSVDKRIIPGKFVYRDGRQLRTFANSKGVRLEEAATHFSAGGSVSAACDGGTLELDSTIYSRTFASTGSLPFGTNLARHAASLLETGEVLDGEVRIVLAPRVTARLFAHLGEAFAASSFLDGTFFLQPRDDDEPIIDTRIHLVDDGTAHGALRTRSFDDRGTMPVPQTLLREGRVDGRFLDPETARRLDTRSTGHVLNDKLVACNLMLRSGTRSLNALLTDRGGYSLAVHDFPDLSGLNMKTGDFKFVVHGRVLKNNTQVGAMRNVTLQGNMLEVLNSVVDVASDTDRVGHVDAPGMILDGCTLTP